MFKVIAAVFKTRAQNPYFSYFHSLETHYILLVNYLLCNKMIYYQNQRLDFIIILDTAVITGERKLSNCRLIGNTRRRRREAVQREEPKDAVGGEETLVILPNWRDECSPLKKQRST